MEKIKYLSDFEREMVVVAIRVGSIISETADYLGFSRLEISKIDN